MMLSTLTHSQLSKAIRDKKKKMMKSEPEMIGTEPGPDMNAQDIYDNEQAARIESTLMSPKKINSDDTNAQEAEEYDGIGLSPEQKKRMGRLKKFLDGMDLNW